MFDQNFWQQFWPQFFGSIASGIVLALLTLIVGYLTRIKLVRALNRLVGRVRDLENK